jgi:hypothetical protein
MEAVRKVASFESSFVGTLGPAFKLIESLTVTTEDAAPFVIRATAKCKSPEDAALVLETLKAALVLGKNIYATAVEESPRPGHGDLEPGTEALIAVVGELLKSAELTVEGDTITVTASIGDPSRAFAGLATAVREARTAAMRVQSTNNLRQLALAFHAYHDKTGSFPPAAVYGSSAFPDLNSTGDAAADVPRSWRVEILPLIGQGELYKQYRLDQPWDSETNRKVQAQMPSYFKAPEDKAGLTNASYYAITGPGTVFQDRDGTSFKEITDGTVNTLLLAEAKRSIPWTKPEDIEYKPDGAVPKLGGWFHPGEYLIAMCDGGVYTMRNVDDAALKLWIEMADDEIAPHPSRTKGATFQPPRGIGPPATPAP